MISISVCTASTVECRPVQDLHLLLPRSHQPHSVHILIHFPNELFTNIRVLEKRFDKNENEKNGKIIIIITTTPERYSFAIAIKTIFFPFFFLRGFCWFLSLKNKIKSNNKNMHVNDAYACCSVLKCNWIFVKKWI